MSISLDPFGLRSLDIDGLRRNGGAKWRAHPAAYSAWVADMDFRVAPAITDRLRVLVEGNEFGYPNWGGPFVPSPAVAAFAERQSARYAWEPRLDRLHEVSDVVQGIRVVLQHLTAPGDGVVLHLPAYYPFLNTIEEMGRRLIPVSAPDRSGFDYDSLEVRLAVERACVWILCHPHNPLGHVFDRRDRRTS